MLRDGQQARVNLAGMRVGSVVLHAAVTEAVGTIVRPVSEDPPNGRTNSVRCLQRGVFGQVSICGPCIRGLAILTWNRRCDIRSRRAVGKLRVLLAPLATERILASWREKAFARMGGR